MALSDQGFGQRFDHVREAAGLREGQAFGCRKKYSQNKLTESAAPRVDDGNAGSFYDTLSDFISVVKVRHRDGSCYTEER